MVLVYVLLAFGCILLLVGAAAMMQQPFLPMTYIGSPDPVVKTMLDMARLAPGKHVIDLGAGDGRILRAAKKREPAIEATGVEAALIPWFFSLWGSRGTRIALRLGSVFHADISRADVIFVYIWPSVMPRLAQKLTKEIKPGAIVISHSFALPGYEPAEERKVDVKGKTHTVRLYQF